jgi:hypothetical protein
MPGGDHVPDAIALADAHELTPVAARRLVYRHGSRALRVLERCARDPREREVVCACEPVLLAEVKHAIHAEGARTVDDVARLASDLAHAVECDARCDAGKSSPMPSSCRRALGSIRRARSSSGKRARAWSRSGPIKRGKRRSRSRISARASGCDHP